MSDREALQLAEFIYWVQHRPTGRELEHNLPRDIKPADVLSLIISAGTIHSIRACPNLNTAGPTEGQIIVEGRCVDRVREIAARWGLVAHTEGGYGTGPAIALEDLGPKMGPYDQTTIWVPEVVNDCRTDSDVCRACIAAKEASE